jgi:predicted dehydrogenase
MKIVIIGLGIQGHKRLFASSKDTFIKVDPVATACDFKSIYQVPLSEYDAAIVATPDALKFEIIKYLVINKKHVLVEKPLIFTEKSQFIEIQELASKNNCYIYVAYNHRFETHFQNIKSALQNRLVGEIYYCKLFYGNGTARLVRNSQWRDTGFGVVTDLGSHLLDTIDFWFGSDEIYNINSRHYNLENISTDLATALFTMRNINFNLEMSLCSWKNTFMCDIIGSKGSLHINGLRKWGQSIYTHRSRIIPSGTPKEVQIIESQGDPTWKLEYDFFKNKIISGESTDFSKDIWIFENLKSFYENGARLD